jgi:D-alanyl-lipoteichoic acid acyltransferase DltB (MBOAT superfamily)
MLVSGVWHGANWTFIAWGGIHGLLLCVTSFIEKKVMPIKRNVVSVGVTFVLAMFCWIFFRANNMSDAMLAINKIIFEQGQLYNGAGKPTLALSMLLIALLMFKEMKDEYCSKPVRFMHNSNIYVSAFWTAMMIVVILLCAQFDSNQFIYFQF